MTLNFPTTRPTLTVDFQKSQKMHPLFNFERASGATQMTAQGTILTTVGNNVPRFAFNAGTCMGLLEEVESANMIGFSQDFANAFWIKTTGVTVTANTTVAPDGTTTASTLTADSDGNPIQTNFIPITAGLDYSQSIFIQKDTDPTRTAGMYINFGGTNVVRVGLNLNSGEIFPIGTPSLGTSPPYVQDVGNWWRLTAGGNSDTSTNLRFFVYPNINSDGAAGAGSIVIWGAQLEERRNFATSYIPTAGGVTATRARENILCQGDDFQTFYGSGVGGYTIRYSGYVAPARWIAANSAQNDNIYYNIGLGTNQFQYLQQFSNGASTGYTFSGGNVVLDSGGYAAGTYEPFVNAFTADSGQRVAVKATDGTLSEQTANVPTQLAQIYLAFGQYNASDDRQKTVNIIARLDYWPMVATNQELEALAPDS